MRLRLAFAASLAAISFPGCAAQCPGGTDLTGTILARWDPLNGNTLTSQLNFYGGEAHQEVVMSYPGWPAQGAALAASAHQQWLKAIPSDGAGGDCCVRGDCCAGAWAAIANGAGGGGGGRLQPVSDAQAAAFDTFAGAPRGALRVNLGHLAAGFYKVCVVVNNAAPANDDAYAYAGWALISVNAHGLPLPPPPSPPPPSASPSPPPPSAPPPAITYVVTPPIATRREGLAACLVGGPDPTTLSTSDGRDPYSWQRLFSNGSYSTLASKPASAAPAPPFANDDCLAVGTVGLIVVCCLACIVLSVCCACCCVRNNIRPSTLIPGVMMVRTVPKNVQVVVEGESRGVCSRVREFLGAHATAVMIATVVILSATLFGTGIPLLLAQWERPPAAAPPPPPLSPPWPPMTP